MSSSLNLTIGVEIEFVLIGRIEKGEELLFSKGQLEVYNALRYCTVTDHNSPYSLNEYAIPIHDRALQRNSPTNYSKWAVDSDSSIELVERQKKFLPGPEYRSYPIELKSRVFDFRKDHWREEISSVLRTLHTHFNQPSSKFRLIVHDKCGFHVHVGNRREGFSLKTLKNLMKLVTAHERAFDSLHSARRISGISKFNGKLYDHSDYCLPPSIGFLRRGWDTVLENRAEQPGLERTNEDDWADGPINNVSSGPNVEMIEATNGGSGSWEIMDFDDSPLTELFSLDDDSPLTDSFGLDDGSPLTDLSTLDAMPLGVEEKKDRLDFSRSPTEWIRSIERTKTIRELCNLLPIDSHSQAYNLDNLIHADYFCGSLSPSSSNSARMRPNITTAFEEEEYDLSPTDLKKTIEFRQHEGSLNARGLLAWIEVVSFLVEWASCADDARLKEIVNPALFTDPEFDVLNLLHRLGGYGLFGQPRHLPAWVFDYYRERRDPAVAEFEYQENICHIKPSDPVFPLVRHVEETRWLQRNYDNVRGKIQQKIKDGRYGDMLGIASESNDSDSTGGVRLHVTGCDRRVDIPDGHGGRVEEWVSQQQRPQCECS